MKSWDRLDPQARARATDEAIHSQFAHAVGVFSPYWIEKLASLGLDPAGIRARDELAAIPAVAERDIAPTGDPAEFGSLVLRIPEHWAMHAEGPRLRSALLSRLRDRDAYRRAVMMDRRPATFFSTGLGMDYLVAATRGDLDLMARAGARLFDVLGISASDALLVALRPNRTVSYRGLVLAALASGVPALTAGAEGLAEAIRLFPATVLAAESGRLADVLEELAASGAELGQLRLALAVGAPSEEDRLAAEQALADSGAAPDAVVLAVHAPAGARVLWGECHQAGAGERSLHTYPDLEVVEVCDPDTGESYVGEGPGETVLTQLGFQGSALVRWRTGDLVDGPLLTQACSGCGRAVTRIPTEGLLAGALVVEVNGIRTDLRAVAAVLAARPDVSEWVLAAGRRARDGAGALIAHLAVDGRDAGDVALEVAEALMDGPGPVTQIVATDQGSLRRPSGDALTARIVRS